MGHGLLSTHRNVFNCSARTCRPVSGTGHSPSKLPANPGQQSPTSQSVKPQRTELYNNTDRYARDIFPFPAGKIVNFMLTYAKLKSFGKFYRQNLSHQYLPVSSFWSITLKRWYAGFGRSISSPSGLRRHRPRFRPNSNLQS